MILGTGRPIVHWLSILWTFKCKKLTAAWPEASEKVEKSRVGHTSDFIGTGNFKGATSVNDRSQARDSSIQVLSARNSQLSLALGIPFRRFGGTGGWSGWRRGGWGGIGRKYLPHFLTPICPSSEPVRSICTGECLMRPDAIFSGSKRDLFRK